MLSEHAQVVLSRPIPSLGLDLGAKGVIVAVHSSGHAYEVELLDATGLTLTVEVLDAAWVSPLST